ncbi:phosphate ABC transporter permease subunit PstC [Anabaenopsis tanganyikae CS-531]|uniref:Phosphate transport system permease protein n=2 Tax=Anabaenopsis TaxID=110103 RepID=A0ABT6KA45_9CYAN|nr:MULTISPECIES: phosphate ABC transporter permease subunit PstC [Anabaenopsis]MDB9540867.1 phosphate ABC transporter permease subunit PstC [Anabaenopsis arnoldii]MDH6093305.1 phosphate ABC transporter permease subunit PstC [Anabaenopsis arnoldii]MDH6097485.1 phosphate ABC transporter permease subunit PstC [Anabaenopsis sp. FSS-46]MDH6104689.1 phosphate ABC transporter permease subunit PstC [Anabaenopsis tanganyikae CS-531]
MMSADKSTQLTGNSLEKQISPARVLDVGFWGLTLILAISAGAVLLWVIIQTAIAATPAIEKFGLGFLVGTTWNPVTNVYGVLPQIYGTLVTALIALSIAIPLGIGVAIFLTEGFAPKWVTTPIAFAIELIVAIPSVVLGIWGIFVLIPAIRPIFTFLNTYFGWIPFFGGDSVFGNSLLIVGLVLAIMIVPIIISITRSTFEVLPSNLRNGSLALGATRWETILRVLIPAGLSGIISSVMLAMGRAMGETMVAAMLVGNANRINISWLQPGSTITGLIASQFGEAGRTQVAALMYAGVVLMLLSLVVNILAEMIIRRFQNIE